jgi:hypothetical protein
MSTIKTPRPRPLQNHSRSAEAAGPQMSLSETRAVLDRTIVTANSVWRVLGSPIKLDVEVDPNAIHPGDVVGLVLCNTKTHVTGIVNLSLSPGVVRLGKRIFYLGYPGGEAHFFEELMREVAGHSAHRFLA